MPRETASEEGVREPRGKRRLADKIRVRNRGASGCGNIRPPPDSIATCPSPAPFLHQGVALRLSARAPANSYRPPARYRFTVWPPDTPEYRTIYAYTVLSPRIRSIDSSRVRPAM